MNIHATRLIGIAALVAVSAICFAPFRDLRSGVKLEPEKSESERAYDQGLQSVQGEIAEAPTDTDISEVQPEGNDLESASLVAGANNKLEVESESAAKSALIEANKQLQASKRPSNVWLWAFVLGSVGVGSVFAIRQYANKILPEMPSSGNNTKW